MSSALCPRCHVQIKPTEDPTEFVCPDCGRVYLPDKEIMQYPDEVVPVGSDEMPEIAGIGGGGAGLVAASDDEDPSLTDQLYKKVKHAPNRGEGVERWD